MPLTQEQINIIKNVKSLDELKQIAEENHIKANDALLLDLYNSYHSESELSDDELDNVTGGCGDKEVGQYDPACANYQYYAEEATEVFDDWKNCNFCKYVHKQWEDGKGVVYYCGF